MHSSLAVRVSLLRCCRRLCVSKRPPVDFDDTRRLYGHLRPDELVARLAIFRMCVSGPLIASAPQIVECAERTRLLPLVHALVRPTIFRHFCAGRDLADTTAVVESLRARGVGAILDQSVEEKSAEDERQSAAAEKCRLIDTAAALRVPFVALKLTSLVAPALLERMAEQLHFFEAARAPAPDWYAEATPLSEPQPHAFLPAAPPPPPLSAEERRSLHSAEERLALVAAAAQRRGVRLLLDAEQIPRQPAIDALALRLCRTYNRSAPIIFNTYQLYLRAAPARLERDFRAAHSGGFVLGIKLVRGAYVNSETAAGRAAALQPNKAATDAAYDATVRTVVGRLERCGLLLGTHNRRSCELFAAAVDAAGHQRDDQRLWAATLQGMCDYLSFGLAQAGFNALKLLPYGEVQEVLPYLLRRLQENRDILGGVQHERALLWSELLRRCGLH